MLIARSFPSTTSTWIFPRYGSFSVNGAPAPARNVSGGVSGCGVVWPSTASIRVAPNATAPAASVCVLPSPSRTLNGTSDESFRVFFLSASSTRTPETGALPTVVPG